jgi:hypothetical protein
MVDQGLILGHIVSARGIEVDKSKIDVIKSLPYPASVRRFVLSSVMQDFTGDLSRMFPKQLSLFVDYCRRK